MSDYIVTYILCSMIVGVAYFLYYIKTDDFKSIKTLPKGQLIVVYGVVFILPTVFAPYALYYLIKITINKRRK